nr:retrovirus-related Pol polyprotein from transposon TNT 1-94 [Tanacetum cinerariifolium]
MSVNTKFANQSTERKSSFQYLTNNCVVRQPNAFQSECSKFSKTRVPSKVVETNDLSNSVTSNSVPTTTESKVMTNDKVIAPEMFRINSFKTSRKDKFVPISKVRASVRKNPIIISQPHVITKKHVNSDSNGLFSTGVDNTANTRRPRPRSNTNNDRPVMHLKVVASKIKKLKNTIGIYKFLRIRNICHLNVITLSFAIRNDKSKVVCAMCKQWLIIANHDVGVLNYMNGMNSRGTYKKTVFKFYLFFGKSSKFVYGTDHFGNDHIATILGYGDLQWGNILIIMVYFVEVLRHNLFLVGQFCDSNLEVTFRRNHRFVRNLKGVDLLTRNRTTNLYTINLHETAPASALCLMAHSTSTKSWLWRQRLSHLNFDTINDLAKSDLIIGLPEFKYHKEHLCPSCEKGKRKKASHPPKRVQNSKQRLQLFHMNLCGPMRVKSINEKLYVLVIVDDYSRYTWVLFLRSKDEAPEEIKIFLKKNTVLLQALVIIIRTDNDTEFKNEIPKEDFDSVAKRLLSEHLNKIDSWNEEIGRWWRLLEQCWFSFVHHSSYGLKQLLLRATLKTALSFILDLTNIYKLINGRKPDISFLYVFGALCYPKNDREDIEKLGAKGFIDADHPSHVYKLKKALYGLKQAPREWHGELLKFLLHNHFFKGTIDPTLFIRRFDDVILVDFGFKLTGYSDVDYAGCKDTFKSTSGGTQFLGDKLVSYLSKKQEIIKTGTPCLETTSFKYCLVNFSIESVSFIASLNPDTSCPIQDELNILIYAIHAKSTLLSYLDKRLSFDELKNSFEATIKRLRTFTPMESDFDRTIPKIANESLKRAAKEEVEQESSKRQKTRESSEPREKEDDELTLDDLQQMMMIFRVEEVYVEALQVKYLIIDWEFYIEESRKYWKIIRVRNHTETYQIFADILKKINRDDLVKLWDLVKERFSTAEPTNDKKKELWVELKRLFEPNNDDTLWKLQRKRISVDKRAYDFNVGEQAVSRTIFRDSK